MRRKRWEPGIIAGLVLLFAGHVYFGVAVAQDGTDWVTKFPRDPVQVSTWPGGKKVAVSFALFVEVFGFGQGPVFRPDLATRNPDLVNEAFRQYAVTWGNLRVGATVQGIGYSAKRRVECHISRVRTHRYGRSFALLNRKHRSSLTA